MPVKVRDIHAQSLATSSTLSSWYVPNFIPPLAVIHALNAAKVHFLLVGTHALGGWTHSPRATGDIDILAGARLHKKAVRVLLAAFPQLHDEEHDDETRLRDSETGHVLIDVMKANQALYRAAFRHSHRAKWKGQTYLIPSMELAFAMKFTAMISATRGYADKHSDAGDFIGMIESNSGINLVKLHALAQLVYNGGGDEIVEKVRQVRAGEKLTL